MSDRYENPLTSRYAGERMQFIFSDDNKFTTWRRLWIALAESERELGLNISAEQLEELKAHVSDINYETAQRYERETRHDVMAHIRAYGELCPLAAPIIHLGATSSYVGDNTDIIQQRSALLLVRRLLLNTISVLCRFAREYKGLPCLAYTHFQAAQPTTVGKRAALWIYDLMLDLSNLEFALSSLKLLGCKGTTGTGASFLELFGGDHDKVKALDRKIAEKMGFESVSAVSGQTYSRKIDYFTLSVLSGIAQSAYKFSNDIRLLSHLKEIEEPFESLQVGSSAMAYKRNPMRSERMASLSRFVISCAQNPAFTAASQWFERTLDDSANRRLAIPQAFLAIDAVLSLYINIAGGITVYPQVIRRHLDEELPFMAAENILMYCVKNGGDRQRLHERIRLHSVSAAKRVKLEGGENDFIARIAGDDEFNISECELRQLLDAPSFTGRAEEQTEEFLEEIDAVISLNSDLLGLDVEIKV